MINIIRKKYRGQYFCLAYFLINNLKNKIMLGDLTKTECLNLLSSQVIGRLACTDGLFPYVVPVTYRFDGEYIYGQTNEGRKLNILRNNPNVCFEVDSMSDMANWKSAIVVGIFEELQHIEASKARAILFNSIYSLMTSSTLHPHEHEEPEIIDDEGRVKYFMYRIKINSLSGRFERK